MEETPIVGYSGIMHYMYPTKEYGVSIYTITDQKKTTLILIPLTLGFLEEAYEIARNTFFLKVLVIMPTINETMCSDLYILMKRLLPLKGIHNLAWVNPERHKWDYELLYETHCCTNKLQLTQYGLGSYLDPYIEFHKSGIDHLSHNIYNLYLWDGISTKYFMNVIDIKEFIRLEKEKRISEMHIPYQSSWFGISGYDIIQQISAISSHYKKLIDEEVKIRYSELENCTYGEVGNFTVTQIMYMDQEDKIEALKNIIKKPDKLRLHSYTSFHIMDDIRKNYNIKPGEMSDIETLR